eukprot:10727579-Prorocentrum_lima.AAC.1
MPDMEEHNAREPMLLPTRFAFSPELGTSSEEKYCRDILPCAGAVPRGALARVINECLFVCSWK